MSGWVELAETKNWDWNWYWTWNWSGIAHLQLAHKKAINRTVAGVVASTVI